MSLNMDMTHILTWIVGHKRSSRARLDFTLLVWEISQRLISVSAGELLALLRRLIGGIRAQPGGDGLWAKVRIPLGGVARPHAEFALFEVYQTMMF